MNLFPNTKPNPTSHQYDHIFKVILIGSTSVGKTALLKRFADNQFNQTYLSTIGIDFRFKYLFVTIYNRSFYLENKFIKLQIWDTAGQQRFKNITKSYYNGSHAIVIVYDVNDERSFDDVKAKWIKDALMECDAKQVFVLANKCDNRFEKYIKKEQQDWGNSNGVKVIGVSAKTANNVQEFFENMTRKLMEIHPHVNPNAMRLELEETVPIRKKQCQC